MFAFPVKLAGQEHSFEWETALHSALIPQGVSKSQGFKHLPDSHTSASPHSESRRHTADDDEIKKSINKVELTYFHKKKFK